MNKELTSINLKGLSLNLNSEIFSLRAKEIGIIKKIGEDGVVLQFDQSNKYDYEYTYFNELQII